MQEAEEAALTQWTWRCWFVRRWIAAIERKSFSFGSGVVIRFQFAALAKRNGRANEVSHLAVCV